MKHETTASVGLAYLSPGELGAYLEQFKGRVLGVVAFGHKPPAPKTDYPATWVDMPVLGADSVFEVWTSSAPVTLGHESGIACARNSEVLFGCLEIRQTAGETVESATFRAYSGIFDFIDRTGYCNLLRVWNYFPGINADESGLERYRGFNIGRHEAFVAQGRAIGEKNVPAACALGSSDGPMIIYFLAGRQAGHPIENPRQTSAYNYPQQFGPRSPTFSRAMLAGFEHKLFISGTASIVGHETLHAGDIAKQTRETLANIRALLEQARPAAGAEASHAPRPLLKVYLKHPDDLALVRAQLAEEFGADVHAIYLQADICRSDLLLEIEGVCTCQGDK
jgi:chorismate lyase/3-hydroxybenzoate synthase